jgi:SIR2-like domain
MDISDRFENILDHLMQSRIVPFVGAGISGDARASGCRDFEPTIKHLKELLRRRIFCHLRALKVGSPERELARGALRAGESERSFGQLAEVGQSLFRLVGVCETIRISTFAELESGPQHYALACLALEGLIDEIISTNWDCCIEGAMKELAGVEADDDPSIGVITDLGSYRRHGARRRTESDGAVLKLYKINGCAERFSKNPDEEHAKEIIVTERQLQDFGTRGWAREMLKDRGRSRSLLFSGFGSDEPQVRHTVLQLLEEFPRGDKGEEPRLKGTPPSAIAERSDFTSSTSSNRAGEHTLFMIAFEDRLSFNQAQIMRGFCEAQGFDGCDVPREVDSRMVTGKDAAYFEVKGLHRKLPAVNFWCALLDAAIHRLIKYRYCKDGSSFHSWLTMHSHKPDAIRDEWLNWLFPRNRGSAPSAFRCTVRGLFGPNPEGAGFLLGRWLSAMGWRQTSKTSLQRPDYANTYCPLSKQPLLPLATLVVLFALARGRKAGEQRTPLKDLIEQGRISVTARDALRVMVPTRSPGDAGSGSPYDVFLVVQDARDRTGPSPVGQQVDKSRIRYEIAIPRRLSPQSVSRVQVETNGRLQIGRRRRIDAEELIKEESRSPRSVAALFAAVGASGGSRARLRRVEAAHA